MSSAPARSRRAGRYSARGRTAGALQRKASALLLACLALLAVTVGVSVSALALAGRAQQAEKQSARAQIDNADLLVAMVDQETGLRGYSGTGLSQFLEPYQLGQAHTSQALAAIHSDSNPADRQALAAVEDAAAAWQGWAERELAEVATGGPAAATVAQKQAGKELFDRFRAASSRLGALIEKDLSAAGAGASSAGTIAIAALLTGGAFVAASVLVLGLMLVRSVLTPVVRLAEAAGGLSIGRRSAIPMADRADEVGLLSRALTAWQLTSAERETVFEQAPVGICRINHEGRILDSNPALREMVGFDRAELHGRTVLELTHPDHRRADAQAFAGLLDGRLTRLHLVSRYLTARGGHLWCQVGVSVVEPLGNGASYFVATVQDITEQRRQVERAAEIQQGLLPKVAPQLDGYELAAVCLAAQDVGGDFYDWYRSADGQLDLSLGDVMGKGMAAALPMATLRAALRSSARLSSLSHRVGLAAEAISIEVDGADTVFATLFHARLDPTSGLLRYVDAGHGHCFVLRAGGGVVHLRERGLPIGVFPDQDFAEGTAELAPGDVLVVFSDGLLEVSPSQGLEDGALAELLSGAGSAQEIVDSLAASRKGPLPDDLTVLALRRLPA